MRWSEELREKWASLVQFQMQWVRELLVRLYEVDFLEVPNCVKEKARQYKRALKTTLPCENGGNKLRHREKATCSKRIAKLEKLHTLSASCVQDDFDLRRVPITVAAETCRPKKIGEEFFSATGWQHSCGDAYDKLGQPAYWPTMTHESRMLAFLSWASLVKMNGDWDRHFKIWQGRLAVTNHFNSITTLHMVVALLFFCF